MAGAEPVAMAATAAAAEAEPVAEAAKDTFGDVASGARASPGAGTALAADGSGAGAWVVPVCQSAGSVNPPTGKQKENCMRPRRRFVAASGSNERPRRGAPWRPAALAFDPDTARPPQTLTAGTFAGADNWTRSHAHAGTHRGCRADGAWLLGGPGGVLLHQRAEDPACQDF